MVDRKLAPLPAVVLAGMLACVAAALFVRPLGVTITDEVQYFTEAAAIGDWKPLNSPASYQLTHGEVPFVGPRYPVGWPALLAPFTRLPWPGLFFATVGLHLLGAWLFSILLARRGLDRRWALLYLAQPTLLAFSRTLMAEPLAALQTVAVILLADLESPFWLGLIAGVAPLVKLSQLLVVAPVAAMWLLRWPRGRRLRAWSRAIAGVLPGLALCLVLNGHLYGRWQGLVYHSGYASSPTQALGWLGLGLLQLSAAWPLLPLGALFATAEELAGALAITLYLAVYGYHYRGPNLLATLVVGARLHTPAIVLLLPGYARLLDRLSATLASATWRRQLIPGVLLAFSCIAPFVVYGRVSQRRQELETLRRATLASLRPGCAVGYSLFALKVLLPEPPRLSLHSSAELAPLDRLLRTGGCVDLIDPRSEPSTYRDPPVGPDEFSALEARWQAVRAPGRDALPVIWLGGTPRR